MSFLTIVSKVLLVSVAVFPVGIALKSIGSIVASRPIVNIAARIEMGGSSDHPFWQEHAAEIAFATKFPPFPCGGREARSVVTLDLARLDAAVAAEDEVTVKSLRRASLADLKSLLTCSVMDGNAWLHLGMVEMAENGLTPEAMHDFDRADQLAGAEPWIIEARLPVYADLASRGITAFQARATRDMDLYVRNGFEGAKAIAWLGQWSAVLRPGFMAGLGGATVPLRKYYYYLADQANIDIGQPKGKQPELVDPFAGQTHEE